MYPMPDVMPVASEAYAQCVKEKTLACGAAAWTGQQFKEHFELLYSSFGKNEIVDAVFPACFREPASRDFKPSSGVAVGLTETKFVLAQKTWLGAGKFLSIPVRELRSADLSLGRKVSTLTIAANGTTVVLDVNTAIANEVRTKLTIAIKFPYPNQRKQASHRGQASSTEMELKLREREGKREEARTLRDEARAEASAARRSSNISDFLDHYDSALATYESLIDLLSTNQFPGLLSPHPREEYTDLSKRLQAELLDALHRSYGQLVNACQSAGSDQDRIVELCVGFRRDVNSKRGRYDARTGAYADELINRVATQYGIEIPYQLVPPATFNVDDEDDDPLAFY